MEDRINQIFNIKDKTVIITGASGFFGRHISRTFLEVDAKVILLSRSDRLLKQTEAYRQEFGKDRVASFQVDFYEREKLKNILEKIARDFDADVIINNAYDLSKRTGFNSPEGYFENSSYEKWESAFESGIYWAVLTTQIFGKHFRKKTKGSIINISSMYGIVSPRPSLYEGTDFFNPPTYSVNKAGIIALTRYVASFWGEYGVRCNAVAPGPFPNVKGDSFNHVDSDAPFLKRLKNNTALKRVGHPSDLRGALIYLASEASSFMTGQVIVIDGGWTIT